jgi:phage shock protein C
MKANFMFCTQCGTRLEDTARYCTSCGKPVEAQPGATGAAGAAAASTATVRKLRRDIAHKKIAGVCAGFAEYFGTDISLMRIIWVALLLLPPNIGIIAYIVAWAVLPKAQPCLKTS